MAEPAAALDLHAPGDDSPHAMLGRGHDAVDKVEHEDGGGGQEELTPRSGVVLSRKPPEDLEGELAWATLLLLSAAATAAGAADAAATEAAAVDPARDTTSIPFVLSSGGGGGKQEEEIVDDEVETGPRENTGAPGALPIPHNSAASSFTSIISSTRIASDEALADAPGEETNGRLGSSEGPATSAAAAWAERSRDFRPLAGSTSERSSSSLTSPPPVATLLPPQCMSTAREGAAFSVAAASQERAREWRLGESSTWPRAGGSEPSWSLLAARSWSCFALYARLASSCLASATSKATLLGGGAWGKDADRMKCCTCFVVSKL